MLQSKLFKVKELNSVKCKNFHDYKTINCEKNKLVLYWESLSLYEKEKIFVVYDLNIIDELVEILNIARSRIATSEFDRKSGQIIKMPEKRILLDYLYFDALGIYFNEDLIMKKFVKSFCLINNKVTNEKIHEKYLEEQKLPECTDFELISAKKKVLKFKIRSLLSILDNLEIFVDQFCSGEKVLLRKRHYSTLYSQLVKNPLPKNPSSDDIRGKIREIVSLLSIMLENNLIKEYNKANKYYLNTKKDSTKTSGSAKVSHQTSQTPTISEKQKTELIAKDGENISQSDLINQNEALNNKKRTSLRIGSKQGQKVEMASSEFLSSNKLEQNQQLYPELNQQKQENLVKSQEQIQQRDKIDIKDKLHQKDKQDLKGQIRENQIEDINIQKIGDQQVEQTNLNKKQKTEQNEQIINKTDSQVCIENQDIKQQNNNSINCNNHNDSNNNNESVSNKNETIKLNDINKPEINQNIKTQFDKNLINTSTYEDNTNISQTECEQNVQNKSENNHEKINKSENNMLNNEILERQKLECLMEIEKEFDEQIENQDEEINSNDFQQNNDAKYSEDSYKNNILDSDNIGSLTSSPGYAKCSQDYNNEEDLGNKNKQGLLIKKYCSSDVESVNQKLCIVNINSLIIKLDQENNEDQDSVCDSDEEYYQPDEKENFHYNQDFKDYDIVDVLGENFKFDHAFCLSKEKINQLLQQQQQYQYHGNASMQQTQHTQSSNKKLNPVYNQGNSLYTQNNSQVNDQKNIYSDESSDEMYDPKNQYLGMNPNQSYQKSRQQQNYFKQDQQMFLNMPQYMNPQYNQFQYIMLLNQNMMMNYPHAQMPPQGKFKNSSKYQRSHHQPTNPMNNTGLIQNPTINNNNSSIQPPSTPNINGSTSHLNTTKNTSKNGNPNNIKSKSSNNQSTHDNQYNGQQPSNNISSNNTNYISSNKGVKNISNNNNNNNNNSNGSNSFSQQQNSSQQQGSQNYRKKRFNNKGTNK